MSYPSRSNSGSPIATRTRRRNLNSNLPNDNTRSFTRGSNRGRIYNNNYNSPNNYYSNYTNRIDADDFNPISETYRNNNNRRYNNPSNRGNSSNRRANNGRGNYNSQRNNNTNYRGNNPRGGYNRNYNNTNNRNYNNTNNRNYNNTNNRNYNNTNSHYDLENNDDTDDPFGHFLLNMILWDDMQDNSRLGIYGFDDEIDYNDDDDDDDDDSGDDMSISSSSIGEDHNYSSRDPDTTTINTITTTMNTTSTSSSIDMNTTTTTTSTISSSNMNTISTTTSTGSSNMNTTSTTISSSNMNTSTTTTSTSSSTANNAVLSAHNADSNNVNNNGDDSTNNNNNSENNNNNNSENNNNNLENNNNNNPENNNNNNSEVRESQNDFVVVKSKISKMEDGGADDDAKNSFFDTSMENSESCPICFEAWTSSGLHRLACLKCGHLFGLSCIEKWLRESAVNRSCPTCNAKAHRRDIRLIFARRLVVLDTCERDRLVVEIDKERRGKQETEMELARSSLQLRQVLADYQTLRQESDKFRVALEENQKQFTLLKQSSSTSTSLSELHSIPSSSSSSSSSHPEGSLLVSESHLRFANNQQCRVLAFDQTSMTLCVSQNSSVPLFAEYGIRKISGETLSSGDFIPMHMKPIRDLSLHPSNHDSLLLSASVDKTVKITSLNSNHVVQIYNTSSPAWSCCWSADNNHHFFMGLLNNNILLYDIRMTSTHVSQLPTPPTSKSVLSLHYMPKMGGSHYRPGGLLVGHLDSSSFYENQYNQANEFKPHPLHLKGLLTSLSIDPVTSHLLASFRPNSHHPCSKHSVYHLNLGSLQKDQPFRPSSPTSSSQPPTSSTNPPTTFLPLTQMGVVNTNASVNQTSNLMSWKCYDIHTFRGGPIQRRLSRSRLITCLNQGQLLACIPDEASKSVKVWNCSSGKQQQSISFLSDDVIDICPITDEHSKVVKVAFLSEKQISFHKWIDG